MCTFLFVCAALISLKNGYEPASDLLFSDLAITLRKHTKLSEAAIALANNTSWVISDSFAPCAPLSHVSAIDNDTEAPVGPLTNTSLALSEQFQPLADKSARTVAN